MNRQSVMTFLWGAISGTSWVVGLFFFRFWSIARDRLFFFFGLSFWVFAVHWTALGIEGPQSDARHLIYLLRLAAFVLILVGIVDKNRRKAS